MATKISLTQLKSREADVPCGKCYACCVSDIVFLDPEADDLSQYKWHFEFGRHVLDRKDNGHCIYLSDGCSIHSSRPIACRRFDCRVWYLDTTKAKRKSLIQNNPSLRAVFQAGRRLADTLNRTQSE